MLKTFSRTEGDFRFDAERRNDGTYDWWRTILNTQGAMREEVGVEELPQAVLAAFGEQVRAAKALIKA